jgi:hypothetical protein
MADQITARDGHRSEASITRFATEIAPAVRTTLAS